MLHTQGTRVSSIPPSRHTEGVPKASTGTRQTVFPHTRVPFNPRPPAARGQFNPCFHFHTSSTPGTLVCLSPSPRTAQGVPEASTGGRRRTTRSVTRPAAKKARTVMDSDDEAGKRRVVEVWAGVECVGYLLSSGAHTVHKRLCSTQQSTQVTAN